MYGMKASDMGSHLIHDTQEIGKRTAIFTSSGLAGQMFSGIMQGCKSSLILPYLSTVANSRIHAAIYTNLDGVSGLPGW